MKTKKKNDIITILKRELPKILAIYLYGSHATDSIHPNSDVDIAFLSEVKTDPVKRWNIQELIAAKLDIDVDLVDLTEATTVLKKEIVEKGILLYSADKNKTAQFEMTTFSMYMDLNESRKHILNDINEKYGRNSD